MFWKMFSSDKRVAEALKNSTGEYNISANFQLPVNDPVTEAQKAELQEKIKKSRLWLEGFNEKDEARMLDPETSFGLTWL